MKCKINELCARRYKELRLKSACRSLSGNMTSNMPQPNVSGAAVQKSFGLFSPFLSHVSPCCQYQFNIPASSTSQPSPCLPAVELMTSANALILPPRSAMCKEGQERSTDFEPLYRALSLAYLS
jgi:hypothetical protein